MAATLTLNPSGPPPATQPSTDVRLRSEAAPATGAADAAPTNPFDVPASLYEGTKFDYPSTNFSKPELYDALTLLGLGDAMVLLQAVLGDLTDALQSITMGRLDADQALSRQRLAENLEKMQEAIRKMQEASRKSKISGILGAVLKCLVCVAAVVALAVAVSSCVVTGGATIGVVIALVLAAMAAFGAAWSAANDISLASGGKGYNLANRVGNGNAGSKLLAGFMTNDWGTMAGAIAEICKADERTILGVTIAFTVLGTLLQAKATQATTIRHLDGVRRTALAAGDMEYVKFVDKFKALLSDHFIFQTLHSVVRGIFTTAQGAVDLSVAQLKLDQAVAESQAKDLEAAIEALKLAIQQLMEHMQSNARFIQQVTETILEILNDLMKNMLSLAARQNQPA